MRGFYLMLPGMLSRLGFASTTLLALMALVLPSHQRSEMCNIDPTVATFTLHTDPPSLRTNPDSSATTFGVGPFTLSADHQEESKIVADLKAALASHFADACSLQQHRVNQYTGGSSNDDAAVTAITDELVAWFRADGGCEGDLMVQVATWTREHCGLPSRSPNDTTVACEPRMPEETVPILMEPTSTTTAASSSQKSTATPFEGSLAEQVLHRFIIPERQRYGCVCQDEEKYVDLFYFLK
jgi:hypothetical protein